MTKKNNGEESDKRRARGDGGLYWDESRQRWIAEVTIGYRPNGKRITRKGSGQSKTAAKAKLKEILRDHEDGISLSADGNYTVAAAVRDWLKYGLPGRAPSTIDKYTHLANEHVIPPLGARKLRELSAEEIDEWLAEEAKTLSTRTLREVRAILSRSVRRAQKRDKVRRNVVLLSDAPEGQVGRPSKSLSFNQAAALLDAAEKSPMHAYIVLSLLTGARTEELRALMWKYVELTGKPDATPPVPPHIMVWRSVRVKGDTKTKKSRRTIALPARTVAALKRHGELQNLWRANTGRMWSDDDLVFITATGGALDAANVRRQFRQVVKAAGLSPREWTPRELRHSFVSLLSDDGVPVERISLLVGHSGTSVTEAVYRHQIRPVIQDGAQAMDRIFPEEEPDAQSLS
jgi:integrase